MLTSRRRSDDVREGLGLIDWEQGFPAALIGQSISGDVVDLVARREATNRCQRYGKGDHVTVNTPGREPTWSVLGKSRLRRSECRVVKTGYLAKYELSLAEPLHEPMRMEWPATH